MKKILTIQDISCFGKCSLTVALPLLSSMGIETVILPTAVLSTHTLFKGFTCKDLSDQLKPITDHWKQEGITFDAIYTGYLGTEEEIDTVIGIIENFRNENTLVFVDPAMGDNGKLYPAFSEHYAKKNADLCAVADIADPNITEASSLIGLCTHSSADTFPSSLSIGTIIVICGRRPCPGLRRYMISNGDSFSYISLYASRYSSFVVSRGCPSSHSS